MSGVADSAAGRTAAAGGPVSFREVVAGSRGFELPGEKRRAGGRVLRDAATATSVLRAWGLDRSALKTVDFARDSLIVVLAAYQPTGGYRARISGVAVKGHRAVVSGSVGYEGGELATQSLERPWVLVAVSRSAIARVGGDVRTVLRAAHSLD
jgi:hypothetical protein